MYVFSKELQQFAQQAAEAINSVINMDITIVDANLIRIAGTGIFKKNINKKLLRSFTFNEVIKNNKAYYIPEAGISYTCRKCGEKDRCKEKAGILVPVTLSCNTIIGALGIFAYTEEDKNILNNNYKDYTKFIEKMADLISSKIEGEISSKNSTILAKNLNMIMEESPYCILAISSNGLVTHFNKKAQNMLNISSKDLLGVSYNKVISCNEISDALNSGNSIDSIKSKIYMHNHKKYKEVILTVHPIRINDKIETITCFFQELYETKRIYEKISMNDAKIAFSNIKGESPEINRVTDFAQRISPSSSTVLITGETGTGKELFASNTFFKQ